MGRRFKVSSERLENTRADPRSKDRQFLVYKTSSFTTTPRSRLGTIGETNVASMGINTTSITLLWKPASRVVCSFTKLSNGEINRIPTFDLSHLTL